MRQRKEEKNTKERQNVKKLRRRQKQLWEFSMQKNRLVIFMVGALRFKFLCGFFSSFFVLFPSNTVQSSPRRSLARWTFSAWVKVDFAQPPPTQWRLRRHYSCFSSPSLFTCFAFFLSAPVFVGWRRRRSRRVKGFSGGNGGLGRGGWWDQERWWCWWWWWWW